MHRVVGRGALALALVLVTMAIPAPAAAQQTIGYPTFAGPANPPEPAAFTSRGMMQAMYQADLANGAGTDFWMDRLLARRGADPART